MSSVYNLEPQPTGSVILHTTRGELAVELFAKQAPLACRNFLQHCLDGYYDNTMFHRLVPGFMLQGGDPTGTGHGGESVYDGGALSGEQDPWPMEMRTGANAGPRGVGFRDEFHQRLKYTRRGLLGMSNEGRPNTNASQFFFTLAATAELNGRNTLFGRIAGDTIYNLAKMGEAEVNEETGRPAYPVRITRTEILVNPFDGMEKRMRGPAAVQRTEVVVPERRKKRKGGKELLSFADDEEEAEEVTPLLRKKAKFDTRIAADDGGGEDEKAPRPALQQQQKEQQKGKKREMGSGRQDHPKGPEEEGGSAAPERTPTGDGEIATPKATSVPERPRRAAGAEKPSSPGPEPEPRKKTALEKTNEEIAALKASMKRTIHSDAAAKEVPKSELEKMIPGTSARGRKRGAGGTIRMSKQDEQRVVDMLRGFQSRLKEAPPEKSEKPADRKENPGDASDRDGDDGRRTTGGGGEEEAEETGLCDLHFIPDCQSCQVWDRHEREDADDDGDEDWMSHKLSFQADRLGKDLSTRRKAEEELVVIDPRERERAVREERRAAAGDKTGREWDQARNAKMARTASLAGRGAR